MIATANRSAVKRVADAAAWPAIWAIFAVAVAAGPVATGVLAVLGPGTAMRNLRAAG